NQRRASCLDTRLAVLKPRGRMNGGFGTLVVGRAAIFPFGSQPLVLGDFRGGHEFPSGKSGRPFERGRAAVVPNPLKVGMTVSRSRWTPGLVLSEPRERRRSEGHDRKGESAPEQLFHGLPRLSRVTAVGVADRRRDLAHGNQTPRPIKQL